MNITDEIAASSVDSEDLTTYDTKGFVGTSSLLYQRNFNFIENIPCEYMHSVCLGLVKRLIELTFAVGKTRQKLSKRKLTSPNLFNYLFKNIQVPHEFSRRVRNLDLGTIKAQEYRNLLLFFFPIIIECIEVEYPNERRIWLLLAFSIRACILPNHEFAHVNQNHVKTSCNLFYNLFEQIYGANNCTYSLHIVASHLLQIRGNHPLTFKSAFKYENFFSEMRNMFHPGTTSTLKQIIQNVLMKRSIEYHCCETTILFKPQKLSKPGKPSNPVQVNNSIVYTFENETHNFHKIVKTIDNNNFLATPIGKFNVKTSLLRNLNWSSVGVYRMGPLGDTTHSLCRSQIAGKGIHVNQYLITCPNNVLREK